MPTPQPGGGNDARLIAGAMSGTSADGVDVALVNVTGRGESMRAQLVAHYHRPYPDTLRRLIFTMRGGDAAVRLADVARCGREISLAYARAVADCLAAANVTPAQVAAVAAHGQTLYHAPPDTIQLLDPALLAAETGVAVVSDFRRADCAAGGQGAPLVPFADYVLFRDEHKTRVLLNIGGIANVTHLPAGAALADLLAFDTGPGNCVSDSIVRADRPHGPGIDIGGRRAARGRVMPDVLRRALDDEYFRRPPPKSTDGPAMIGLFDSARRAGANATPEDLLMTACALTAQSVADAMRRFLDPFPDELIVSGGGVNNDTIMSLLRQHVGGVPVRTTDELGVPADAKEAIAFALLAGATLDGLPSNVPSATGARHPAVLGSITPRP